MKIVLKLGGAALKSTLQDDQFLSFLAANIPSNDELIIVHGGGPEINAMAEKLGIESSFHDGQRITSPELLGIVQMILCGKINPQIVHGLNQKGARAVGLSGVDDGLLQCDPEDTRLGKVGFVKSVRREILDLIIGKKMIPVIAPLGILPDGSICNVNADVAAAGIAKAVHADKLLFLTDRDGILDAGGAAIANLKKDDLRKMMASTEVSGGMKVKARSILDVLENHSKCQVMVANGFDLKSLEEFFAGRSVGTRIQ
jgi:acetylglutamate kinase